MPLRCVFSCVLVGHARMALVLHRVRKQQSRTNDIDNGVAPQRPAVVAGGALQPVTRSDLREQSLRREGAKVSRIPPLPAIFGGV